MRITLIAVSSLLTAVLAARNGCDDHDPWKGVQYDALILGGGPAGLQTASSMGRLGRKILLVSNDKYRNNATMEMHDVAALDGTPPPVFRSMAREKLARYPNIHYSSQTITKFDNVRDSTFFRAHTSDGKVITARKVVIAMGVWDTLPNKPGVDKIWGVGAYWCIYCDGFEHGEYEKPGGELAVLTLTGELLSDATQSHKLNSKITMLLDGKKVDRKDVETNGGYPGIIDGALKNGITFEPRRVASVAYVDPAHRNTSFVRVTYQDKTSKDFSGLLIETKVYPKYREVIESLKLAYTDETRVTLKADSDGLTNVVGVLAAGDIMNEGRGVATALYTGKKAGIKAVARLAREDTLLAGGYDWRGNHGKCAKGSRR